MALTLLEAAKRMDGEVFRQGVIELYAQSTDLLRVLPFMNIAGNAYRYNQESTLPGIGFRKVNGTYPESVGVINPVVEPLVIAGGELDVDEFILKSHGEGHREAQEAMKIKALAHKWTHAFFKGDSSVTVEEFDGLQSRITGGQLIEAGATSGGDALSLAKLDELIDKVENPTHLVMNKGMRRLLTAAARSTSVSGYIHYTKDEFGRIVTNYNDLPILIAGANTDVYDTLSFTESGSGGGSAVCTSIYCLSLQEGMVCGLQNGAPEARDLGELETKPARRTRIEWYCGMAVLHPFAAARLRGIKSAAVVA